MRLLFQDPYINSPIWLSYIPFNVSYENLVEHQYDIPLLMIFYTLLTRPLTMYGYCEDKFDIGHCWEAMGQFWPSYCSGPQRGFLVHCPKKALFSLADHVVKTPIFRQNQILRCPHLWRAEVSSAFPWTMSRKVNIADWNCKQEREYISPAVQIYDTGIYSFS